MISTEIFIGLIFRFVGQVKMSQIKASVRDYTNQEIIVTDQLLIY